MTNSSHAKIERVGFVSLPRTKLPPLAVNGDNRDITLLIVLARQTKEGFIGLHLHNSLPPGAQIDSRLPLVKADALMLSNSTLFHSRSDSVHSIFCLFPMKL